LPSDPISTTVTDSNPPDAPAEGEALPTDPISETLTASHPDTGPALEGDPIADAATSLSLPDGSTALPDTLGETLAEPLPPPPDVDDSVPLDLIQSALRGDPPVVSSDSPPPASDIPPDFDSGSPLYPTQPPGAIDRPASPDAIDAQQSPPDETETEQSPPEENDSAPPPREPSARPKKGAPRRPFTRPAATPPTSDFSDDELRQQFEKVSKSGKAPDPPLIQPLRRWIACELETAAMEHKLDYGLALEKADLILQEATVTEDEASREQRRAAAAERLVSANAQLAEVTQEWSDRISNCRADQDARVAAVQKLHEKQLESFQAEWGEEGALVQFNKPSPKLITLRETEHKLAVMKQFERAKIIKAEADKMEQDELADAHQRAIAVMQAGYDNLDAKQKREMECLLQYNQRNVEYLERERDLVVNPLRAIVERLGVLANPPPARDRKKEVGIVQKPTTASSRPAHAPKPVGSLKPAYTLEMASVNMQQFLRGKKPIVTPKKKRTSGG
jgi:hypothetical protein